MLKSKRLFIEEIVTDDASFFYELMNSPGYINNIGDRKIKTIRDAEDYIINKIRPHYIKHGYGFYKMVEQASGFKVGTVGLVKRPHLKHTDIGYALLPNFEKRGFATEAAQVILDYALNELKLNPVWAVVTFDNKASQRVLERIGLTQIGTTTWDDGEALALFSTK